MSDGKSDSSISKSISAQSFYENQGMYVEDVRNDVDLIVCIEPSSKKIVYILLKDVSSLCFHSDQSIL